ncbi:MAG TPA: SgcJ/EcaC family oxidoreductase [Solirubrobacteraceae bacterium]|nr:SgcJ/EcaC family oxidoreductase [Solirubrobacteraceae bacterium]
MAAQSPAELLAAFLAAVNARDIAAAVELWREDAAIVQLDGEVLRGHDAIAGALQAMIDNRIEIDTEVSGIVEAGDVALVTGTLTLSGANGDGAEGRFTTRSSSIVIYKRDAEGWRIALDAPWGLATPRGTS